MTRTDSVLSELESYSFLLSELERSDMFFLCLTLLHFDRSDMFFLCLTLLHFAMSSRSQSGLSHSQSNLRFSEFASDFPTYLDSPHGALSGD